MHQQTGSYQAPVFFFLNFDERRPNVFVKFQTGLVVAKKMYQIINLFQAKWAMGRLIVCTLSTVSWEPFALD
jgi:hypothetical protein